jgi:hypothetical protein
MTEIVVTDSFTLRQAGTSRLSAHRLDEFKIKE